jgi:hypothetical protein
MVYNYFNSSLIARNLARSAATMSSKGANLADDMAAGAKKTGDVATKADEPLNFKTKELLESHWKQHNPDFKFIYDTPDDYLKAANDIIKNGTYIGKPRNGYYVLGRINRKGKQLYYFVGVTDDGKYITTYMVKGYRNLFG